MFLCDTSSGFWKDLYLHQPAFSYDVSVSIYRFFLCSILLNNLAFSSLLHDHPILCCLIVQTWDLMSISRLLISLPLFVFPADFCRLTLVNCACVWQELLAQALTQLLEDSQLLEEAYVFWFSGCFVLLTNLSPSPQKDRACHEEQKSMISWGIHHILRNSIIKSFVWSLLMLT